MNNEDNLELVIKIILELVKKYALVETSNKKYSLGLLDIKDSTISGRTYRIYINEELKGYDSNNEIINSNKVN